MTQTPNPTGDPTPIEPSMQAAPEAAEAPEAPASRQDRRKDSQSVIREIMGSSGVLIFFAILLALIIGAILVAAFDPRVQTTASYLFARPSDFFAAVWHSISGFFSSLFRGALFDYSASSTARMVRPLTESMTNAVPLILAGLSVAVAFRAGLFNIGAQGQIILGALVGGYVGIAWELPVGLHLIVAVLGAALGGAIWGSIPGILKAKAGANEVIVTIMLNSIALYLLSFFLKTKTYIGAGYAGKSENIPADASYPLIFGPPFRLHYGILVALAAAAFVWWLLERSTLGFEIRAAGANPSAARTAGVSVNRTIIITMIIAGALAGLAATGPVLGTERFLSNGVAASFGFDAITVALLGRSRPVGVVFAGLLFGALNAGAATMQAAAQIPVDIVQVAQAIIVLLIAAPPLVRWILRLPDPERRTTPRARVTKKEVAAA
ncbi:simple sugar transport system permease protein [Bowdeniella nasicola]|uniref:Simple sugar transport system permease protein n=2 Tax=Bowdeniella nasicola TaxID=208480 RepID=A0A1H3YZB1_9ACTO|nr:ABC transporter permease [Bowdeniella nasicola]SEA16816.1 simple sugar transport system permease protein [Bowdeniella nasicola]